MKLFQMQLVSICLLTQVHFSNTKKKSHELIRCVQFVVLGADLHQITLEIMLLLVNNLHEKSITGSQDRRNFESACVQFVIRKCNLHLKHIIFS